MSATSCNCTISSKDYLSKIRKNLRPKRKIKKALKEVKELEKKLELLLLANKTINIK